MPLHTPEVGGRTEKWGCNSIGKGRLKVVTSWLSWQMGLVTVHAPPRQGQPWGQGSNLHASIPAVSHCGNKPALGRFIPCRRGSPSQSFYQDLGSTSKHRHGPAPHCTRCCTRQVKAMASPLSSKRRIHENKTTGGCCASTSLLESCWMFCRSKWLVSHALKPNIADVIGSPAKGSQKS